MRRKVEEENLDSGMVAETERKRGAYNGILNELRLTDKEDFRKYLRMNTTKRKENNFIYHISFLLYMRSRRVGGGGRWVRPFFKKQKTKVIKNCRKPSESG